MKDEIRATVTIQIEAKDSNDWGLSQTIGSFHISIDTAHSHRVDVALPDFEKLGHAIAEAARAAAPVVAAQAQTTYAASREDYLRAKRAEIAERDAKRAEEKRAKEIEQAKAEAIEAARKEARAEVLAKLGAGDDEAEVES